MANTAVHIRRAAELFLTFLTIPFTTQSCSVKEMRGACPCRVDLDLTELLECREGCRQGTIETSVFDAAGTVIYNRSFGADTCSSIYELLVPRGKYSICALYFSNVDVWNISAGTLGLKAGAEPDSLYGETAAVDATGEEQFFRPAAFKQFTTVNINFTAPVYGLSVGISAPSSSVNMCPLEGGTGELRHSATVYGQKYSRRICRQSGDDIIVSFTNPAAGSLIARVSVAELMRSKGYEYNAKSLGDIDITVDFGLRSITLETEGWKESFLNVIF